MASAVTKEKIPFSQRLPVIACAIGLYAVAWAFWANRAEIILRRIHGAGQPTTASAHLGEISKAAGVEALIFFLLFCSLFATTKNVFLRWLIALAIIGVLLAFCTWIPNTGWK